MDDSVKDALSIFYKFKKGYENEKNKKKQKILANDELSFQEKHEIFSNQKFKCVNCRRNVNTIFQINDEKYVAICGANSDSISEDPCSLNIKITKGNTISLENHLINLTEQRNKLMKDIMKIKYDILFNLEEEEKSLENFQKQKDKYNSTINLLNTYQSNLISITESLDNKEKIKVYTLQINELINEIKKNIEESIMTSNSQLIKDSVEIYINNLLEIIDESNKVKYSYRVMEMQPDKTFKYVEKKYTIDEIEIEHEKKYKVESLIIGKKK